MLVETVYPNGTDAFAITSSGKSGSGAKQYIDTKSSVVQTVAYLRISSSCLLLVLLGEACCHCRCCSCCCCSRVRLVALHEGPSHNQHLLLQQRLMHRQCTAMVLFVHNHMGTWSTCPSRSLPQASAGWKAQQRKWKQKSGDTCGRAGGGMSPPLLSSAPPNPRSCFSPLMKLPARAALRRSLSLSAQRASASRGLGCNACSVTL